MAELEDDLAALAPVPDTPGGLATLHAARRRRQRSRLAVTGSLSLILVVAISALWSARTVDDEIGPAQVGGPDEPATTTAPPTAKPVPECELEAAGFVEFQGAQGIAFTVTNDEPCEVSRISAIGRLLDGGGTEIPLARWEDQAEANLSLPVLLMPSEGVTVIVHNRAIRCRAIDDGYVDIELRVGDQVFDPVRDDGPWPICGIAIAVVDSGAFDSDAAPAPWVLLAQTDAVVDIGTLAAAASPGELGDLWETHGLAAPLPDVDFADAVVVALTISDDVCPPELTGFEQSDDVAFTPAFEEPDGPCYQPLRPKTYVVVLARHFVGDAFVLRLPADDPFHGEQRLTVVLAGGPPLCELELSLAISRAEPRFPSAFEEAALSDAFAVSFVNVSAEPCLIVDVGARGENEAGDVLPLPQLAPDPVDGLALPANIDAGRGFWAVFTRNVPFGLCDAPSGSGYHSLELVIGDRVVDISPGLSPNLVFPCGGFFRLEPTVPPEGVPGDPLDQRFRVCLLSFPAQCDDPFIRVA